MDALFDPAPSEPEPELAQDVRGRVKAELEPGERLLWAGAPVLLPARTSRAFWFGVTTVVVCTIVACVAFVTVPLRFPHSGEGLSVVGLVSTLVAFATLLGTIAGASTRAGERAKRSGMLYALTDRRAIIWVPDVAKGMVAVHSIPRGSLAQVHRLERPDGSGDVVFTFARGDLWWPAPSAFESVPDVRRVEEQVRRTLVDPTALAMRLIEKEEL
jgi:hypothetical protein